MAVDLAVQVGASALTVLATLAVFIGVVLNLCVFFPGKGLVRSTGSSLYSSHIAFTLYLSRASFVAAYMVSLVLYDIVSLRENIPILEALLVGVISALVISYSFGLERLNSLLFRISRIGKGSHNHGADSDSFQISESGSHSLSFYCFLNSFLYGFALVLPVIWITQTDLYHLTIISLSSLVNLVASVIFFWQGSFWMQSYLQKVHYPEVLRARLSASVGYVLVSVILALGIFL